VKLFCRTKPITIDVEGVPSPIEITDKMVSAVIMQQMYKFQAFARLAHENTMLKRKVAYLENHTSFLEAKVRELKGAADAKSAQAKSAQNDASVSNERGESIQKRYVWLYPRNVGSEFFLLPVQEKYNTPQTALLPVENYNAESWRDSHNCAVVGEEDAQKILEIVKDIESRKKDETKQK